MWYIQYDQIENILFRMNKRLFHSLVTMIPHWILEKHDQLVSCIKFQFHENEKF